VRSACRAFVAPVGRRGRASRGTGSGAFSRGVCPPTPQTRLSAVPGQELRRGFGWLGSCISLGLLSPISANHPPTFGKCKLFARRDQTKHCRIQEPSQTSTKTHQISKSTRPEIQQNTGRQPIPVARLTARFRRLSTLRRSRRASRGVPRNADKRRFQKPRHTEARAAPCTLRSHCSTNPRAPAQAPENAVAGTAGTSSAFPPDVASKIRCRRAPAACSPQIFRHREPVRQRLPGPLSSGPPLRRVRPRALATGVLFEIPEPQALSADPRDVAWVPIEQNESTVPDRSGIRQGALMFSRARAREPRPPLPLGVRHRPRLAVQGDSMPPVRVCRGRVVPGADPPTRRRVRPALSHPPAVRDPHQKHHPHRGHPETSGAVGVGRSPFGQGPSV
jgi:hypothetical protein